MTGDTSRPEPLQGDAAREALREIVKEMHKATSGTVVQVSEFLAAHPRVLVLPEPEPPCVEKIAGALPKSWDRHFRILGARNIHAASLCSCAADALLRRWVDEWPGSSVSLSRDTSNYLEVR